MSEKDAQNISLRELVRQNLTMMEQHKRDSDAFRESTTKTLTAIMIHSDYAKTSLKTHTEEIKSLNTTRDNQKGFFIALSFLGLGFLIDFIKRIFG